MDSLYSKYLTERTDDRILETPEGFATYRYLNERQCYIIDIYVVPEFRKSGIASTMANIIASEAKKKGCTELLGTVNPTAKGSKASLLTLFAYGMDLVSAENNVIVLRKDI